MNRTRFASTAFLASLFAASSVLAEEASPTSPSGDAPGSPGARVATSNVGSDAAASSTEAPAYEKGGLAELGLVAGAKLGGGFSQPFNKLGTSFVGELEIGYLLPPLDRSIEVFLSGQYSAPTTSKSGVIDTSGPDGTSRVPGAMSYDVTEQQAIVTLGGLYRLPLTPVFRPYAALGGRMYLLKTKVSGKAGDQSFGENQETATKVGFFGALGGELYLGPGAALLEVQTGYAGVNGFVLRDTNVGALNVALGYRLFI